MRWRYCSRDQRDSITNVVRSLIFMR